MEDPVTPRGELLSELQDCKQRISLLEQLDEIHNSLLNSTPDAIVIYDLQGRALYVNESFVRTFGWTTDEVQGKTIPYVPEFERSLTMGHIDRIIREGTAASAIETKRYTKDGRLLDVSISASRFNDHAGTPAGMVVILRDISQAKATEEALRASEASYRGIFDSMNDAILVHDMETGRIIDVNRKMCEMYGYTAEEVRDLSVGDISLGLPPYSDEDAAGWVRKAVHGESQLFDWLSRKKDGDLFWTEMNLKRAVIGGKDRILAVVRDISERKRTEEALRSSEELQRTLLAASPVGIGMARDREMVWVNRAWSEMFGFPQDDATYIGRSARGLYCTQEEFERAGKVLYHDLATGQVNEMDVKMCRKDGSVFDAHITLKAVDPSDLHKGTIAIIMDITARKRIEQALRESEQRLELALRGADLGFWDWNIEAGRAMWDDRAISMIGYSTEDIEPNFRFWKDLTHPDDWPRVSEAFKGHLQGRLPLFDVEYRMRSKSGEWLWIRCRGKVVERDATGKPLRITGTTLDITERRRAEEILRESEGRYRAVFNNAAVGINLSDRNGRFLTVNAGSANILGYTQEELQLLTILDVTHPDDVKDSRERFHALVSGATGSYRREKRYLRKDGEVVWADLSVSGIRNASGELQAVLSIFVDITDRKRAEDERASLRNQLLQAQKMQAIGTLTGGIAHDFNNMLTIILGYSELLLDETPASAPQHADLEKIVQTAQSGADLVQRLLTFSRQTEVQPRRLNLNDQIRQIEKLLSKTIPKMVEIKLVLADDLAPVKADPAHMEQVVMNLAVNASEAMPDGGTLMVETQNVVLDEASSRAHHGTRPGDYVLLRVSDTGRGMDPETMDRMFDPFFTTKGWDSRKGTGLGLPVVQGVIRQHDGCIECFSEPGKGTTFDIYLPVAMDDVVSSEAAGKPMPPGGSETLLLAEDEAHIRDLGTRYLERAGYTVLEAKNGREALELYNTEKERISLIILDLIMPEMGGKQCMEQLVKMNPEVKVLIASGYSSGGAENELGQLGAKRYVAKPFDMRQLLHAVREVLDEK